MSGTGSFIEQLRWSRKRLGLSQLALANLAEISQRHLSFLEVGRAQSSREMVLRLAAALELPLRRQNALLLSSEFAPFGANHRIERPRCSSSTGHWIAAGTVSRACGGQVLERVARERRLSTSHGVSERHAEAASDPDNPVNVADVLLAPNILRPLMPNWGEVARDFIRFVHADVLRPLDTDRIEESHEPVLTMEFVKNGVPLRLYPAIATLGTP